MARRVGFGDSGRSGETANRRSVLGRIRSAAPSQPKRFDAQAKSTFPEPKSGRFGLVSVLFLLLPLVFAGVGGYLLVDAIRFMSVAEEAVGAVVDVETNSDSDGTSYTAIFRYRDTSGRSHTAPTHIASSGYDYRIGETEEILYDPASPDAEVRVNGVFSLWGLPVIFSAVGLLILTVFGYGYRKYRQSQSGA